MMAGTFDNFIKWHLDTKEECEQRDKLIRLKGWVCENWHNAEIKEKNKQYVSDYIFQISTLLTVAIKDKDKWLSKPVENNISLEKLEVCK